MSLRGCTIAEFVAMQNVSLPRGNSDLKFIYLALYFVMSYLENLIRNALMQKL